MLFKVAILVVVQALYASAGEAQCGIDVCAFQKCARRKLDDIVSNKKCCETAVKGLCDLNQLLYGFDPAEGPETINHDVTTVANDALNVPLHNVIVKGIRGPDSYSNYECYTNGFKVDIHFKELTFIAATSNNGAFTSTAKNVKATAKLNLSYDTKKNAKVVIEIVGALPSVEEYSVSLGGKQVVLKKDDVSADNLGVFVAMNLNHIYSGVYTKLFNKYKCCAQTKL